MLNFTLCILKFFSYLEAIYYFFSTFIFPPMAFNWPQEYHFVIDHGRKRFTERTVMLY